MIAGNVKEKVILGGHLQRHANIVGQHQHDAQLAILGKVNTSLNIGQYIFLHIAPILLMMIGAIHKEEKLAFVFDKEAALSKAIGSVHCSGVNLNANLLCLIKFLRFHR